MTKVYKVEVWERRDQKVEHYTEGLYISHKDADRVCKRLEENPKVEQTTRSGWYVREDTDNEIPDPCPICHRADKIHFYTRSKYNVNKGGFQDEYSVRCDRWSCRKKIKRSHSRNRTSGMGETKADAVLDWNSLCRGVWRRLDE